MPRYVRNHLQHDDGLLFAAPILDLTTLCESSEPHTPRRLEYDGTEQSLAKISEVLRGEAIKSGPN